MAYITFLFDALKGLFLRHFRALFKSRSGLFLILLLSFGSFCCYAGHSRAFYMCLFDAFIGLFLIHL